MTLSHENNSDNCLVPNVTCSYSSYSLTAYGAFYMFGAILMMFMICGNLLVIISICHFKQLHTPTNVLICSLAMSDLLVGLFVLPGRIIMMASCTLFQPMFCSVFNATEFNVCFISIYNISLIAADRYLALRNPFMYARKVSLLLTSITTALVWIVSLIYNFAFLYFNGNFNIKCPNKCLMYLDELWTIADLVLAFIFPCATIVVLYMKIFFIARKHIVAIRLTQGDGIGTNSINKWETTRSAKKAGRALGIVVLVFFVCLIPYFICTFTCDFNPEAYDSVVMITMIVFYLNSAINPVIYALFYPWFQNSVKMILSLRICRAGSSLTNVLSGAS